jgi:hypothetical protein
MERRLQPQRVEMDSSAKITAKNPIVELHGSDMTRVIWRLLAAR